MNQQYIENYTNDNMRTINRMIELNSQIITYMSNFNRHVSNMNYINYVSNNIQNNQNNQNNLNNQNNTTGVDEIINNDMNYYSNLYNIYNNISINNISNIIENCLDYYIYNNLNEENDENEENEENVCPITKEEYKNGEKIGIIKKCSHSFNYDNIHKWLCKDLRCPLCRHSLLDNSNYIEFINNEEKLILTHEQFLNLMKDYYNIDARFLLENNATSFTI